MKNKILHFILTFCFMCNVNISLANNDSQRVVLLINGYLGDKSFFDSAHRGLQQIKRKYGTAVVTKTIEMGIDAVKWHTTLVNIAEQDWDLIITGTYYMADSVATVASQHPDKYFIIYDAKVTYDRGDFSNVYSISYRQNEGAYLGGMLAAGLLAEGALTIQNNAHLGFLGGMDIPVINDFLVGYITGAQAIDSTIKVSVSYVGNFHDAAKGKELALVQYNNGVGIGFNAAAAAGLGQLAAAKTAKRYALGVDTDQAAIFAASDPALSSRIVSSVLKQVDASLIGAYERFLINDLPFGKAESWGLRENSVALVTKGAMEHLASAALKKRIEQARRDIIAGRIQVPSALGMDAAKLAQIRDSVRP